MKNLIVKGYSLENDFIVLDAQGMQAFMLLSKLLWQDKTKMDNVKIDYNVQKQIIVATTTQFKYTFENVPLQWDGNIDNSTIYANHIQELRDGEVI
jgi:hypothetical protein